MPSLCCIIEKDLTSIFAEIIINKAKELLVLSLNSIDNESKNSDLETEFTVLILTTGSILKIEADNKIEISQITNSYLTLCVLIDIVNKNI
ncbi:351_t:CDS:2 [Funneliformis mosseae]|uniref:351_t:CDS:1 n=1 Tax=Funneliformis mosseae TaxID=27381 RepID=A0A9N8VXR1_FUNMO|nr:351_t:CDS:2 [Funneliformis mosseae]